MSPPSIVIRIVWPCILIVEFEKITVRTVCGNICSFFISWLILINPLTIQPLVKGTAVIKHTVQNDLHPPTVYLFHKFCKKTVAGFQIFLICHTTDVFCCMGIILISRCQHFPTVFYNLSIVRINIIIILYIVLMIRRRYKNRIKIYHVHAQILQIIQLIPNSLDISPVKLPDSHKCRTLIPVLNLYCGVTDIEVLPVFHII